MGRVKAKPHAPLLARLATSMLIQLLASMVHSQAGKKMALLLFLLLFSVTTNAQTCVKVDDDNSPAAIVSGRITTHHKLPKGSELVGLLLRSKEEEA
jgi:hypothetical protein